jgi:anti-sigma-K factor RskA
MNTTRHIEQDELALFAMQLLSAEEASAVAQHVEQCGDCRRELAAVQGDLAVYAHTVDLQAPPALARERLMKQVAREKKIVPMARPAAPATPVRPNTVPAIDSSYRGAYDEPRPQRSLVSKVLPWAGWAVAAGLALSAGHFYNQRNALRNTVATNARQQARLTADAEAARQVLDTMNDATALRVTLQKPQTAPVPQARTIYVADKGALVFLASNLEPLPPDKTYELWLIPADRRDPIPAGTFRPDAKGNANVILPTLPKGVEAKAFGITIEDEGGATTPTMPIILAGAGT